MVIARSYILACGRRCGRRGAAHIAPSARRCGQQESIRKLLSLVPSGLPRARAAVRRWSTFAFEVHAGTYAEVFLIFGVNWRAAWTALSILLAGTGGARASREPRANRRKIDATDRPGSLGICTRTALPALGALPSTHAARRPWNTYLENLPRGPHSSGSAAGGAASFRGTEMVPYLE